MIQGFIGDVHGKYRPYKQLIERALNTIQVGDMGVGFRRTQGPRVGEEYGNPPHYAMILGNHRFIRGNHDNPTSCKNHSQWIADGTVENNMMFVGGAFSIDAAYRIPDYSWWPDEELSQNELEAIITVYLHSRPKCMVTHDAPEDVIPYLLNTGQHTIQPSRTRNAFQRMWSACPPQLWVFGHWHKSLDLVLRGTRFVCLAELEYKEFEI